MAGLKLRAEDGEDLAVISAAIQDGVFKMGDVAFDRRQRRLAIQLNRFRWEADRRAGASRIRAVLAFEGVLAAQSRKVRLGESEAVASILALGFTADAEPPSGAVEISLAGGGSIRLQVEALEAVLFDVGEPWGTLNRPDHGR